MQHAIALAKRGAGSVSPNPMVGAVIVKNGKVIGEGWHEKFGGSHAEVNAVGNAFEPVRGATIYVTLEPCSYHGKTPACAPMLVREGFSRVVLAVRDPNPKVSGAGVAILKENGIEVTEGVEADSARQLNQPFFKAMQRGLPYMVHKAAITLDAFIADKAGHSKWISCEASRQSVHRLRAELDAVMVGVNTVLADDPELTVRLVTGRNPKRIIADPNCRTPLTAKVVQTATENETFIISRQQSWRQSSLKKSPLIPILFEGDTIPWNETLKNILQHDVQSVLAEGGAFLQSSLIAEGHLDRLELFISPKTIGEGHRMMRFPNKIMAEAGQPLQHQWAVSAEDIHFSGIYREY
jgi:diaminohydroxyphosphoribosylaminopyrimidine deaminase / 5-amino-6-(5-phosphoribosylamino)uracil reductase